MTALRWDLSSDREVKEKMKKFINCFYYDRGLNNGDERYLIKWPIDESQSTEPRLK